MSIFILCTQFGQFDSFWTVFSRQVRTIFRNLTGIEEVHAADSCENFTVNMRSSMVHGPAQASHLAVSIGPVVWQSLAVESSDLLTEWTG